MHMCHTVNQPLSHVVCCVGLNSYVNFASVAIVHTCVYTTQKCSPAHWIFVLPEPLPYPMRGICVRGRYTPNVTRGTSLVATDGKNLILHPVFVVKNQIHVTNVTYIGCMDTCKDYWKQCVQYTIVMGNRQLPLLISLVTTASYLDFIVVRKMHNIDCISMLCSINIQYTLEITCMA